MAWLGALTIPIGLAGGAWWALMIVLAPAAFLCAPTVAATGEEVPRLAPAAARGEATGLQSSAFTLGAGGRAAGGVRGGPFVGGVGFRAGRGRRDGRGWVAALLAARQRVLATVASRDPRVSNTQHPVSNTATGESNIRDVGAARECRTHRA